MFNRIVALFLLVILSPIFLIVGLLIFLQDGLPVFFKQKRVGVNYSFFYIYKFRTMKKDTPNVATHLLVNPGQYVLKTGKLLRKLSLDELPNLNNIIKGEMAVIGKSFRFLPSTRDQVQRIRTAWVVSGKSFKFKVQSCKDSVGGQWKEFQVSGSKFQVQSCKDSMGGQWLSLVVRKESLFTGKKEWVLKQFQDDSIHPTNYILIQ